MINKAEFNKLRNELGKFELEREHVIQLSREIIGLSKHIIYSTHRNELIQANKLIKEIKNKVKRLPKLPYDTEIYKTALQEYVEALAYYHFIKDNKLITKSQLKVDAEAYLLGLCDLTGELVRRATNSIVNKNFKESEKIKEFVNNLYGEFIKFNFRNGELRKKADFIRWNLKKLEEVMFDLKIRGR